MEAHTPKRKAIQKFVATHAGSSQGYQVQVVDEQDNPIVLLEARANDSAATGAPSTLEIHTRQVTLTGDGIDASTAKMIERWLESLKSATR